MAEENESVIKVSDIYQGQILPDGRLIAVIITANDIADCVATEEEDPTAEELEQTQEILYSKSKYIVDGFLYNWMDIVSTAIKD